MKLDYIFVDEISMLHSNFYKILMIIKKLKNCKLIISGDFNQLDVINDLQKYNYKDASILKELCDNNIIKLSKCRRSDDILFNLIQFDNIPNLEKTNFNKNETEVNICWTNEKRKSVNDKYMKLAYKKDKTRYYFRLPKLQYDENSQDVILVRNMPLIAKVNNSKLKLINNDRYIITKIDVDENEMTVKAVRNETTLKKDEFQKVFNIKEDDYKKLYKVGCVFTKNNDKYVVTKINTQEITFKIDGNEIIIQKDEFQKLFRVGYCFTCHSVQGMSIDKPYTIHEWERMHQKLKYVALSRATKKENINII
jgi:hypothetical protein